MNSIYYTHYCSFEQHFLYNVDVYFVKIIIRGCQSFCSQLPNSTQRLSAGPCSDKAISV